MSVPEKTKLQLPLLQEEDELLRRSSKKSKSEDKQTYEEAWPKLGVGGKSHLTIGQSFAEKLQGIAGDDHPVQVVRLDAEERKVLQQTYGGHDSKEKRGSTKKKQYKSQSLPGENKSRNGGRQEIRREKRLPELDDGKTKGNEVLYLTYRSMAGGDGDGKDFVRKIDEKEHEVGPLADEVSGVDLFNPNSLGPDDPLRLDKLQGRFWDGLSPNDPGLVMMVDGLGEGSANSCVPESQTLFWNVRGACANSFLRQIRTICRIPNPDIVLLDEMKCEKESRFKCLQCLGFDGLCFVLSTGRSGGLIAAWKTAKVDVVVMESCRQFTNLCCTAEGQQPVILSVIYALPTQSSKSELWQRLLSFSASVSEPWSLIGDFNYFLSLDERVGGPAVNFARISLFQERMVSCGLSDLGSIGPRFT
ncbi:hypothetical protein K1719_031972 [Acacia pycnantha]|nr:hypothetical protein K1719_031972 [Acacia pycnantha]